MSCPEVAKILWATNGAKINHLNRQVEQIDTE